MISVKTGHRQRKMAQMAFDNVIIAYEPIWAVVQGKMRHTRAGTRGSFLYRSRLAEDTGNR